MFIQVLVKIFAATKKKPFDKEYFKKQKNYLTTISITFVLLKMVSYYLVNSFISKALYMKYSTNLGLKNIIFLFSTVKIQNKRKVKINQNL